MSATIDVPIPNSSAWIDINTVSGIAVGAAMSIQNKGYRYTLHVQEFGADPMIPTPPPTLEGGRLVIPGAVIGVNTGSLRVWAISASVKSTIANVQAG